jgi:hypothetical protein
LNIEDAQLGSMLESESGSLFAVGCFDYGQVSGELTLEELAQVSALSYVVFGYEN